jgi:hypothetical protein
MPLPSTAVGPVAETLDAFPAPGRPSTRALPAANFWPRLPPPAQRRLRAGGREIAVRREAESTEQAASAVALRRAGQGSCERRGPAGCWHEDPGNGSIRSERERAIWGAVTRGRGRRPLEVLARTAGRQSLKRSQRGTQPQLNLPRSTFSVGPLPAGRKEYSRCRRWRAPGSASAYRPGEEPRLFPGSTGRSSHFPEEREPPGADKGARRPRPSQKPDPRRRARPSRTVGLPGAGPERHGLRGAQPVHPAPEVERLFGAQPRRSSRPGGPVVHLPEASADETARRRRRRGAYISDAGFSAAGAPGAQQRKARPGEAPGIPSMFAHPHSSE